jgi:molybdopterin-guanine dinucleotide biosynthesis protein A
MSVAAIILAGGLARRMGGGQKALLHLGGRHLVGHAIERIAPQAAQVALNVNVDDPAFGSLDLPLVKDTVPDFAGPLAGILAGLEWAAAQSPVPEWLLSAPTDAPFLPGDLVERLLAAAVREDAEVSVAESGDRTHPVVALWRTDLRDALHDALVVRDIRKIDRFTAERRTVLVEWSTDGGDPFFNVNKPHDLEAAEALLA